MFSEPESASKPTHGKGWPEKRYSDMQREEDTLPCSETYLFHKDINMKTDTVIPSPANPKAIPLELTDHRNTSKKKPF